MEGGRRSQAGALARFDRLFNAQHVRPQRQRRSRSNRLLRQELLAVWRDVVGDVGVGVQCQIQIGRD